MAGLNTVLGIENLFWQHIGPSRTRFLRLNRAEHRKLDVNSDHPQGQTVTIGMLGEPTP